MHVIICDFSPVWSLFMRNKPINPETMSTDHPHFPPITITEITQIIEEIKKNVPLQPPHSIMALLDMTGTKINRKRIKIIQSMAAHHRPYVKFIAIVSGFSVMLFIYTGL